jgi:hypothetical protein
MALKKIKISELPLADTLKGLYTIGIDALNRSVKVSLEFVKKAADRANEAADKAQKAAEQDIFLSETEYEDLEVKDSEKIYYTYEDEEG